MEKEATAKVLNKVGLHARPATLFVEAAKRFSCEIRVEKEGLAVDAKSILGILRLGAEYGSVVKIRANGEDAEEAVRELVSLIERRFDE